MNAEIKLAVWNENYGLVDNNVIDFETAQQICNVDVFSIGVLKKAVGFCKKGTARDLCNIYGFKPAEGTVEVTNGNRMPKTVYRVSESKLIEIFRAGFGSRDMLDAYNDILDHLLESDMYKVMLKENNMTDEAFRDKVDNYFLPEAGTYNHFNY